MTTQRGYDPREFSLIGFGGAGGLHAADLARELRISEVVVPLMPGLMSARGILHIDVRHDLLEPLFERASSLREERVEAAVERLDGACEELRRRDESIASWRIERRADIRYFGQISGYLTLDLPDTEPITALRDVVERFGEEHRREFGYQLPAAVAEAEIVNLRAALIGEVTNPPEPAFEPGPKRSAPATAEAWFAGAGRLETAYVEREGLRAGERIEGPAVITEWEATTVVPPGGEARVEPTGDLSISVE
jgi:N-methylhydantoinase A